MNESQWIARRALRLREEWSRLAGSDLAEVAAELWVEDRWRTLEPEIAATAWLRQGIPTVAQEGSRTSADGWSVQQAVARLRPFSRPFR